MFYICAPLFYIDTYLCMKYMTVTYTIMCLHIRIYFRSSKLLISLCPHCLFQSGEPVSGVSTK